MEFIMIASKLGLKEIGLVIEFMGKITEKKGEHIMTIKENPECYGEDNIQKTEHTKFETRKAKKKESLNIKMETAMEDVKTDILNRKESCKLDPNGIVDQNKEIGIETITPVKRGRGLPKGSSFMGTLDKRSKIVLGSCKCPLCKKEFVIKDFPTEKIYRNHVYAHGVGRFCCECDKTWETKRGFKHHVYISHRGNFHCDSCKRVLNSEEEREEHTVRHAHKDPFVCDDCGFTSMNKQQFYSHVNYYHDTNMHVCELCSQEFQGNAKFKVHIRRFHAEKKPCPLCGKLVKSMWIHKKNMHTNDCDKKYNCDQCEKGFVEKGKLEIHVTSVHSRNRPFVCRYQCGAATSDKGNRKKHELAIHGNVWLAN